MYWYVRWFGAPRDLAERGPWARQHPLRASAAYALLVSVVLIVPAFLRTQRIELSAALFVGSFLFLFAVGRVGVALGARSLAKSQRADQPTP
jgi:hypothetical protein